MVDFTKWTDRYQMDVDETDRIFTYLNQPHNSIVMPINILQGPARMSDRPDHYARLASIIEKLKTLGDA